MKKDKADKTEKEPEAQWRSEDYTAVEPEKEGRTHVSNAHASGLGAMGRNDEKLPTGEGQAKPQEPAY